MNLDELLDHREREPRPERRAWLVVRILLLMLAATAIGGALLVLLLYVVGVGLFAAWVEYGGPIG